MQGHYDELRPGRPRSISDEKVASLLRRTLKSKPPTGTHWSIRQAAQANRLSKSTIHRVFQTFALQPHRTKTFKLSHDPFFCREGARDRWLVPEPSGPRDCSSRRREVADPDLEPDTAHAPDGLGLCRGSHS